MGYVEKKIGFCTDFGKGREKNEDTIVCFTNPKEECEVEMVIGIADGMGSYTGGEIASRYVAEELENFFQKGKYRELAKELEADSSNLPYIFKMAVEKINSGLFEKRMKSENTRDMGSTFTGALAYEMELYLAHVGDSRAYRLRQGKLTRLTEDHTIGRKILKAQEKKTGELPPESYHNILYRSMGYRPWIKMDFQILKIFSQDFYLFCSDGFYNYVDEIAMVRTLLKLDNDPLRCPQALVQLAKENGSTDNISVACVLYVDFMGLEFSKTRDTARLELEGMP